jgi:hypothetical protein
LIRTEEPGVSDHSTNLIKFYGHSLGEADYSYLQALFDDVDFYKSHTRYFFKEHDGGSISDAQEDMSQKVTKLMNKYAATMVINLEHERNLMHKLLL